MLMRNEHVKFLDQSIPRSKGELLCGERKTTHWACDKTDLTNETIDEMLTQETYESPLGLQTKFKFKTTQSKHLGVHKLCITQKFTEYPFEKDVKTYQVLIHVKRIPVPKEPTKVIEIATKVDKKLKWVDRKF